MMKRLILALCALVVPQAMAQSIDFSADDVSYTPRKEIVDLKGNVKVTRGNTTLTSGLLTIHMSQGEPTEMVATGNATFTRTGSEALTAKGDKAVYAPTENKLTLTGNVVLTRQGNTLKGENLVYDLTTGNAQLTGGRNRVSGSFTPPQPTE